MPVESRAAVTTADVLALAAEASALAVQLPSFEELSLSTPARLAVTALVAGIAFGLAYLIRGARVRLSEEEVTPLLVDLVGAALTVGVAIFAVYVVAGVWGETEALRSAVGGLELQGRAPLVAVTLVVLIAVQVLSGVGRRLLDDITRESDAVSEHEREVGYRMLQLILWAGGIVVLLGLWEVNLSGLLVGAGFLGIVLGLAAQQTLGALFAGLVLMFSRPFEVGDWVEVGEHEGIVTDITVMNTSIQAFDGEYVVVPNDVISSQTVQNRSRKGRLRIEVDVGVDYTADVERAREVATEAVAELDIVMDVPRPESVTKSFDDSAVTIGVRGWIEHPSSRRRWRARTGMIRAVKDRFDEEGIKIPFPQRELSGRAEEGGLRVREGTQVSESPRGMEPGDGERSAAGGSGGAVAEDAPADSGVAEDAHADAGAAEDPGTAAEKTGSADGAGSADGPGPSDR